MLGGQQGEPGHGLDQQRRRRGREGGDEAERDVGDAGGGRGDPAACGVLPALRPSGERGAWTALAKQTGIQKIEVQSYNYNVYPVSSGSPTAPGSPVPYQYNGSVSFSIDSLAKGPDLMAVLSDKGYSANLNVNAYRQCQ